MHSRKSFLPVFTDSRGTKPRALILPFNASFALSGLITLEF